MCTVYTLDTTNLGTNYKEVGQVSDGKMHLVGVFIYPVEMHGPHGHVCAKVAPFT